MSVALAERLDARAHRTLFVVGKGGVGKTTASAAVALGFAESGLTTHLISTDPAHSVGDVFGLGLAGGPCESPCTPALTLEELDARAYARRWIGGIAPPLARLVEAGTYLDAADALSLTDLSLPGVDEIMAMLRLVDLADGPAARLVVDTAPTGHALRLLDAGDLVAGWIAALAAMAAKARAVASGLLGVPAPAPGEDVLDQLRQQVERFRRHVLGGAGFLVVTRSEPAVAAETDRLLAELRRRGLAVDALLVLGGEREDAAADPPRFAVPLMSVPPRGCAALRAWGSAPARPRFVPREHEDVTFAFERALVLAAKPSREEGAAVEDASSPVEGRLLALEQQLFLFAGKGGVGKTTCASAFALARAATRQVTLLSTDPAGSLADVLGVSLPSEGAQVAGVLARQIDAAAELARVEASYRREVQSAFESRGLASAALDRAVVETLWGLAPPGVDELLALGRIVRMLDAGGTVVIDPAPTGHFLRLLEMPSIALDWTHALMRLILKYHLARELDAIARDLLEFARDLKELLLRLADPDRTAAFVVTLAEPVVAAETGRLLDALAAAHVPVASVIHNRADAGPAPDAGELLSRHARTPAAMSPIRAPALPAPPMGIEALRGFLRRWEFAR